MSIKSTKIFKLSPQGKLLVTYTSFTDAVRANKLRGEDLSIALERGTPLKGVIYRRDTKPIPKDAQKPWERGGFFDVDGWSKVNY